MGKYRTVGKSDVFRFEHSVIKVILGYPSKTIKQTVNVILNFIAKIIVDM